MSTTPEGRPLDELLTLGDALVAAAGCDAEAVVSESDLRLTRFAANQIHQSVAERGLTVRLRLIDGARVAVVEAGGSRATDVAALAASGRAALTVVAAAEPTPLPGPQTDGGGAAYDGSTAESSPQRRAAIVERIVAACSAIDCEAYGAVSTQATATAVVNSRGLRRAARGSSAEALAVARNQQAGSGYAGSVAVALDDIDVDRMAQELADGARRNRDRATADPGTYRVVLAPYAVGELLGHLALVGLSARAVEEGRSFMRMGERLMDQRVTIYDDAAEEGTLRFPFDAEGVTTQRVTMLEAGVCREVVHDSATARRAGRSSTGHALPMPNSFGPWTAHLAMAPGEDSLEDLIAAVGDGIYVTRFWYVRDVHPLRTVITGMTRDGTFRIRNGRIAEPIADLRFTSSVVDALDAVIGIGRERRLLLSEGRLALAPAIATNRWTFSS